MPNQNRGLYMHINICNALGVFENGNFEHKIIPIKRQTSPSSREFSLANNRQPLHNLVVRRGIRLHWPWLVWNLKLHNTSLYLKTKNSPGTRELSFTKSGQPFVRNRPPLYFSMSTCQIFPPRFLRMTSLGVLPLKCLI